MMLEAIGSAVMTTLALMFVTACVAWRLGGQYALEQARLEQAERRALRRSHARAIPATGRHQAAPWPEIEPFEKLATTGELRAMAETGETARLQDETAAFFQILALRDWMLKKERAS